MFENLPMSPMSFTTAVPNVGLNYSMPIDFGATPSYSGGSTFGNLFSNPMVGLTLGTAFGSALGGLFNKPKNYSQDIQNQVDQLLSSAPKFNYYQNPLLGYSVSPAYDMLGTAVINALLGKGGLAQEVGLINPDDSFWGSFMNNYTQYLNPNFGFTGFMNNTATAQPTGTTIFNQSSPLIGRSPTRYNRRTSFRNTVNPLSFVR